MFRLAIIALYRCLLLAILPGLGLGTARAETLTLGQVLRETAEHNPAIIQQRYAISQAGATRLVLRSRALPIFTVGGVIGQLEEETVGQRVPVLNSAGKRVTVTTPTTDQTTFIVLGTETLYQPLFDAAIPASFRRGNLGVLAEQENLYAVATAQLHLARTQFLEALFQQKSGEILHDVDTTLEGNVRSVSQLSNAGLVGQTTLLNAQVQRANFDPAILASAGSYKTTLARLLQTMGREPGVRGGDALAHITLAGTLGETLPTFDPADAARRALDRRPDLRSLRAMIRANTEDVNIAKAGYYPLVRLYLNGEAIPQSNVRNNTPDAVRASDQVSVTEIRPGIDENWTIIDTGNVRGDVRNHQDTRDILALSLARLERAVPADLAVVRARLTDATSTTAALQGSVDTARRTLDIIQAGEAQGINSQLEFLDAQGGVFQLRAGLLNAQLEMSLAHAEFDRITGNYLRFVDEGSQTDSRVGETAAGKHSQTAKK